MELNYAAGWTGSNANRLRGEALLRRGPRFRATFSPAEQQLAGLRTNGASAPFLAKRGWP